MVVLHDRASIFDVLLQLGMWLMCLHSGLCVISALVGGMSLSLIVSLFVFVCLSLFFVFGCGHVCVFCGYRHWCVTESVTRTRRD